MHKAEQGSAALLHPSHCRLLSVEHSEENGKACLYLVSWTDRCRRFCEFPSILCCAPSSALLPSTCPQVFEYLQTDLKKWMDKSGKGPAYPLPLGTVKVRCTLLPHLLCPSPPLPFPFFLPCLHPLTLSLTSFLSSFYLPPP